MAKFLKGSGCPTCGRSGKEKGNLVSTLDVYTQSVYLTEDAYVFQNAYWHRKLIPDPQGYLDLQKLLRKRQAPEKDGKLELREKLEENTEIVFNLQKFKCLWIFTNRLLCWLPYQYRDWFKEATFFVRPYNEDLPYFGWLKGAIKARWTRANYIFDETANSGKGEWKENPNPINSKPLENPKPHELDFLRRVEELVKKYLSAYTYTHEKLRIIYEKEYLNEVNKVVDEFNHKGANKWPDDKFDILDYCEIRLVAYNEFKKLRDHIEKKMDNTRQDYEPYFPVNFEKVNDYRMVIILKRDFTAEWYQRAFELLGNWTFQKRPFTKQQLEEWNELHCTDGTIKKEPLKSHVFCPTEGDVGKSEDYAFDHFRLIDHKAGVSDSDYKLYLEQASKRNYSVKVERSITVLEGLLNSSRDLENRSDENIEIIIESLKEAKPLVDDTMKTRIEKAISGFGKEMARRKGKKEEYERYERERQADRQRLENIERNNSNLQAQLNSAISNNNTSEQDRLRQRIAESENEARRLRENIRDYENRLRNLENRRS